jgi:hypothetical protein
LDDVLGIGGRADNAERMAKERSLLSSRKILECPRIPAARALDK